MLSAALGAAAIGVSLGAATVAHAGLQPGGPHDVAWEAPRTAPQFAVPWVQALRVDGLRFQDRFAQSSVSRFQQDASGRRTREVSDQEHAKDRRDRGHNMSFDELFHRARSVGRGEYLGVEPDISSNIYRFKFMRTTGKVVWVDMDGQTGRVIAERE